MFRYYESESYRNYNPCLRYQTSTYLQTKGGVQTSVRTEGLKAQATGKIQKPGIYPGFEPGQTPRPASGRRGEFFLICYSC